MNNRFRIIAKALALCSVLSACSAVLENQKLDDQERPAGQEVVDIEYKPLTFEAARAAAGTPFFRSLMVPGIGAKAGLVRETTAAALSPPPAGKLAPYRLGIGDEVTFVQLNDGGGIQSSGSLGARTQRDNGSEETSSPAKAAIISEAVTRQMGRIGSDGSALFIGIGRVELAGKTISEARGLVTNALIRTGGATNFQLEISNYNSQFVLLTSDTSSLVTPITEKPLSLREFLVTAGLSTGSSGLSTENSGFSTGNSQLKTVRLIRGNREYHLPIDHVFSAHSPSYYLVDKDHVIIKALTYKPSSVYVVGAVASPSLVPITAEGRETLADVLFTEGGTLATPATRKSEIYLLRGQKPTTGWHLNAQNPARLMVAAAMELRPDDIIFVTEKPLASFGKTIATVLQLRTFYTGVGG
tara:strand:- start:679 stop:1920 length:1242 start_codon:yes stop_codon:yes gene_type:complete